MSKSGIFETDGGVQCHGPTQSHRDEPIGPTPQPRKEGVTEAVLGLRNVREAGVNRQLF
jgi:hypothetical protein